MKKIAIELTNEEYARLLAYKKTQSTYSLNELASYFIYEQTGRQYVNKDALEIYNKEYQRVIKMLSKNK